MLIDDSALLHGRPYDPVKAREYYLKTRKLKGRQPGRQDIPTSSGNSPGSKPNVKKVSSKTVKSNKAKRLREAARVRQEALERRLEKLRDVLEQLIVQSKGKDGADKKSESKKAADKKAGSKSAKDNKPLTAKEKREAAERAKESYEETKKGSASKSTRDLELEIVEVQAKIKAIRADLQAAAKKARKKASSKSKTRPAAKTQSRSQSKTAPKGR